MWGNFVGATALHYAMLGGHLDVAAHLIGRCKADVGFEAMNKMNVVHAAVSSGDVRVVQYALSKTPCEMHVAQSSTASTVVHIAASMYMSSIFQLLL